jgi:hypothetical protein
MTTQITNDCLLINGATRTSYNESFNIKSSSEIYYACYPVLQAGSHSGMKDYLTNFPKNSVMLPAPLTTGLMYGYAKSNASTYYTYAFNDATSTLFTGQHITLPDDLSIKEKLAENVGLIMSSNDTGYTSYNDLGPITGVEAIQINECLPNSSMSCVDNDPCVFGIVVDELNGSNSKIKNFMDDYESNDFRQDIGKSIRVNSLGEGAIWVSNINGPLKNGDLITSSRIPGVGKRQDDDFVYNYTIAKVTMSCDFDLESDKYKSKTIVFEGQTYVMAFVGVVYHCG